ncbi:MULTISPECIES: hypothetical protein [Paenibacillus]|nr:MULTISPECIES: hypothetical protein [Paenibacillus]MCJ1219400.1 hypothetical protein [Paenibacillus polymyxa]
MFAPNTQLAASLITNQRRGNPVVSSRRWSCSHKQTIIGTVIFLILQV